MRRNTIESDVYYAISEPVHRQIRKQEYKVFLVKYDFKAFMSLPLKDVAEAQRAGNVCIYFPSLPDTEKKEFKDEFSHGSELRNLLVNALLAFNALQHKAPLALCDNEIIELDSRKAEEVLKKLLEFVEKNMKPVVCNNCVQVIDIDFKTLANSLISLTIYDFIAKRLENSNLVRRNGKGVNVDSLLAVFKSIY
ncbi:MAG: hypothetical protein QXG52_07215 [Candidatus Caldarchaeum sp.]